MTRLAHISFFLAIALTAVTPHPAAANVKLAGIFGDHMVLQQQMPLTVWGTADPGEQVTVTIADQKVEGAADAGGKWSVKLQPMQASNTPRDLNVVGKNSIKLSDLLVGEVWVCSGQSNMEFIVRNANNAQQEMAEAKHPEIRLFTVEKAIRSKPQADCRGHWDLCTPQTVQWFSAVGYFFGRDLQKSLEVPVGLIHTSWGGTPAEAWTEHGALESDADFKLILDRHQRDVTTFEKQLGEMAKWLQDSAKAEADGGAVSPPPVIPKQDPRSNPSRPAGLYNGMIAPLIPLGIRGVIWYQGETNAGRAYQYRKLLPTMIKSWRDAWGEGNFPFLIVSLANFSPHPVEPGESDWAELREAQAMTANQSHNGLALAIDVGDAVDIHPHDKQTVGARLALVAEGTVYGKEVSYQGPTYDSMTVEDDKVRIHFKHTDGGLVAKGDELLKGFAAAGADHKWHWADATIDGDSVVVHSDKVKAPLAVRYAWATNPVCNLYNKAGLPAVPFRTDDWKGVTANSR